MPNKREEFIKEVYTQTYQLAKDEGISHDFIMAQVIQETGWGEHMLEGTNNIFNIKANSSWEGEKSTHKVWEIEHGKKVWVNADFRKYESYEESVNDWLEFLHENKRYEALFEEKNLSTEEFANRIQDAGYATDPNYAQNIVNITHGRTYVALMAKAKESYEEEHTENNIELYVDAYDSEQDLYVFDMDENIDRDNLKFNEEGNIVSIQQSSNNQQDVNNQPSCDTPPWMTIAIAQAKEIGGRNERQVDNIIRGYHKSATGSELKGANTAWCASFVSWALKESGMEDTPNSAGSRFFRDESDGLEYWNKKEGKNFGKGLEPIEKGEEKLGDIAVWADLNQYGEHEGSGHVAFVFGKDENGNKLFLGGNQGDTLGVKEYSVEDTKTRAFIGYFRPEEAQNTHSTCDLTQYSSVSAANEAAIGQEVEIGDSTR